MEAIKRYFYFFLLNTTKHLHEISNYGDFLCLFLDDLSLHQTDVSMAGFANRSRHGWVPHYVVTNTCISFVFTL